MGQTLRHSLRIETPPAHRCIWSIREQPCSYCQSCAEPLEFRKALKKIKSGLYIKPLSNVPKILLASAKWDHVTAAESGAGGGKAAK